MADPDLDQGLFWVALALENQPWPGLPRQMPYWPMLIFGAQNAGTPLSEDQRARLNAFDGNPDSEAFSQLAIPVWLNAILEDYSRRGGKDRLDAAQARAATFQPVPLDLSD